MKTLSFKPGAVSANTNITLPGLFGDVRAILKAYLHAKQTITHAACAATSAAYASATNLGSAHLTTELTVVTGTPASGEIQLVDKNTIQLGDATGADDVLELTVLNYGDIPGY